jgi:hypothetical protein
MQGSIDGRRRRYLRLLREEQGLARLILDLTVELALLPGCSLAPGETPQDRATRISGLRLRRNELESEHLRMASEIHALRKP